ncbi:MAG TPA: DUF2905 domain-containing protein [Bryobacteraceae bacterium]
MGRTLIALGVLLIVAGLLLTLGERLPLRLGRLPGDIVIRGKNGAFYFPIVTCIVISVALSLLLRLLRR